MKSVILTLVSLLLSVPSVVRAQSATPTMLDSMATVMFLKGDYDKSLALRQQQLGLLKPQVGEADSTYIMSLLQLGKCYFRLQQLTKAIAVARQVVNLYGTHVSTTDSNYAFALDNLALYQGSAEQNAEGLANAEKALAVYQHISTTDHDMAIIQMHVAELSGSTGNYEKAITHEQAALEILKHLYGEHSKEYTDEAEYLVKYYDKNGDQTSSLQLAVQLEKLKKETENGEVDLPQPMKFNSATDAHEHNADALRCINYLLSHPLSASKISEAVNYILNWTFATDDCEVVIGDNEKNLEGSSTSLAYFMAYIAACGKYALTTGKRTFTLATYKNAMVDVLNYYQGNKAMTGEVPYLEQYIKAFKKGPDKLEALLEKNFPTGTPFRAAKE